MTFLMRASGKGWFLKSESNCSAATTCSSQNSWANCCCCCCRVTEPCAAVEVTATEEVDELFDWAADGVVVSYMLL